MTMLANVSMFAPGILLWEAFVSLAMLGFGFALLRGLRLPGQPVAVVASVGVAGWLLLGGWLNLTHLASSAVLLALLLVGVLLLVHECFRQEMRVRVKGWWRSVTCNTSARNLAIPIVAYFLLVFASHLRPVGWNKFDDQQSYMALAEKAASFDHMPSDPFNERRTNSGIGGAIFLDRTMLAGADDSSMDYLDSGFGYLVFLLAMWSIAKAFGLSSTAAVFLLYLVPFFPLGKINLSVIFLSTSFFLSMLLILLRTDWDETLRPNVAMVLGFLLGAACTAKSSNIPFGILFLGCVAVAMMLHLRTIRRMARPVALNLVAILLVVLPWMAALHHDQGTYFFPTLGRGVHATAYGFLSLPSQAMPAMQSLFIASPLAAILLVAGVMALWLSRGQARNLRLPMAAFFAAALLSTLIVAISTGSEALDRYTLPFNVPCVLLLACCTLGAWQHVAKVYVVAAAMVLFACAWLSRSVLNLHDGLFTDLGQIVTVGGNDNHLKWYLARLDPGTMQAHGDAVRRAQEAIPAGKTILESTETAYGYDWHRNTVYIADYPGMAGPPPGPPVFGTSDDLRRYLVHCGVQYVIYDRALYLPTDFEEFRRQRSRPLTSAELGLALRRRFDPSVWSSEQFEVENQFRKFVLEIAQRQPVLYDDGRIEVIDLQ